MVRCCCVVGCKNSSRSHNKCKYFSLPSHGYKLEQRKRWIDAVGRKNPNGSAWNPKSHDVICSDHFIGGEKSNEEMSPSYIPTIFPHNKKTIVAATALKRHKRFMERWWKKKFEENPALISEQQSIFQKTLRTCTDNTVNKHLQLTLKIDQSCQAEIFFESRDIGKTFTCNRYVCNNICDAEIQTEINIPKGIITIKNTRKFKDKACGTR